MYDKKWLIYSLDEEITLSDLKSWNYNNNIDCKAIENWLHQHNVKFQIDSDLNYKFSYVKSKPYIIYYKWNIELLNKNIIWIVGPRKNSPFWTQFLDELFKYLKSYDIATISWMAEWIDEYAHTLSMENNIPTIAVLWWWLWYFLGIYKRSFINKIVDNWWLVISEFKLKMKPTPYSFPQRNRIIAWLSNFVILPEAWEKSGSLITVDFALSMWKEVYWFPNTIFSETSRGINKYISENKIKCIYDIKSLLDWYFTKKTTQKKSSSILELDNNEKIIYKLLDKESLDINVLIERSWIDMSWLVVVLSMLEIKWLIFQKTPWVYWKK